MLSDRQRRECDVAVIEARVRILAGGAEASVTPEDVVGRAIAELLRAVVYLPGRADRERVVALLVAVCEEAARCARSRRSAA